ncbi:MAG: cadmium-translocating P-type ATPase [Actinomycetales bacterium]|nr:cadmium-translocating P-type ATPase [Actinomycetales bacterium]
MSAPGPRWGAWIPSLVKPHADATFFAITTLLLAAGALARVVGPSRQADLVWTLGAGIGLTLSTVWVIGGYLRRQPSVDIVALLALAGSLAVGEPLAGAVIAWMLATGRVLETRAEARARRELSLLVQRAPRTARRLQADGLVEVPVSEVARGNLLLVGPGEVVPVDGHLVDRATLDESALTGEPLPVERPPGEEVRSGSVNAGSPFSLVATAGAADSTYARIVTLVEQAQASSAPFVRIADRFAVAFVPLTLVLAGLAWAVSGDAVRAVAVLVVATPCPLLLAAPIAVMSGLSRAARAGVVVKGGAALERLAAGRVLLFDKTGTLTVGRPTVVGVVPAQPDPGGQGPVPVGPDEMLRLAASLEQVSPHVLASAIVAAGRAAGHDLVLPTDVVEHPGHGLEGVVDGHRVTLGRSVSGLGGGVPAWVRRVRRRAALDGSITVFAVVDGVPAGAFLLEDPIRPDAPRMVRALRRAGLHRIVLVTGDRADVAMAVGRIVGIDAVQAERDPAAKLSVVTAESEHGLTIMVGDGVNDAPALAAAGVGVALAARGVTASSEAADVVLTVDRIDGLVEAIGIAHRSRRIARQSVSVGMGLSLVAMVVAALGHLPPTAGALLQEVIDVLAIGLALRAVLPGRRHRPRLSPTDAELLARMRGEHHDVLPVVEQVRSVADALGVAGPDLGPVRNLLDRLEGKLLPHERAEEEELYPVMARLLGGDDPIGAMSRAHAEIEHQVARLRRLLEDIGPNSDAVDAEDVLELQRLLYGLYAVLRLHNAQEDEGMFSLLPPVQSPDPSPAS